jgi:hypothetical protein
MRARWIHVLALAVGVPLILAVVAGGTALLRLGVRTLAGQAGELVVAFVGLYVLSVVGCGVVFAYCTTLLDRDHEPPRPVLLGALLGVPAVVAGLNLGLIHWLCAPGLAWELTHVASSVGSFFLVLLGTHLALDRWERRAAATAVAPEPPDPNDPNQRLDLAEPY